MLRVGGVVKMQIIMKSLKIIRSIYNKNKIMSKEMREQIDRIKNWKQFLNENKNDWEFNIKIKISDILPIFVKQ